MKDLIKSISFSIMFNRIKEFEIILEQASEAVQDIRDSNSNSLIHILICRDKMDFLKSLYEIFEKQNIKKTESEKKQIFKDWINHKNSFDKTAIYFAVKKGDLVI